MIDGCKATQGPSKFKVSCTAQPDIDAGDGEKGSEPLVPHAANMEALPTGRRVVLN